MEHFSIKIKKVKNVIYVSALYFIFTFFKVDIMAVKLHTLVKTARLLCNTKRKIYPKYGRE